MYAEEQVDVTAQEIARAEPREAVDAKEHQQRNDGIDDE